MDQLPLKRNLQIIQWNARSLSNKLSGLQDILLRSMPHIVAIQEIFLKPSSKTPNFSPFNAVRADRLVGERGGLLLLVHNTVNYLPKTLTPYPNGKLEIQAITIQSDNQDIDIVNLYNPDNSPSAHEFQHYIDQFSDRFIFLGDFNGHHPLWEPAKNPTPNTCGRALEHLIADNANLCLATPDNLPTHTDDHTGETSTIDLVFCSRHYLTQFNVLTLADQGSDHTPLLNTVEIKLDTQILGKRPKWRFTEENWGLWLRDLDTRPAVTADSPSQEAILFTEALVNAGEAHFKKTSDKVNTKRNKWWWNAHCARATALRRRAKNRMRRRPTRENILTYRRLHAAAIRVHKVARRTAWRAYVNKITSTASSKEIWNMIRRVKGFGTIPRSPIYNGNHLTFNIQEKAEVLVLHYKSQMFKLIDPRSPLVNTGEIDRAAVGYKNAPYNKRYHPHEIITATNSLPTVSTCGKDYLHNQFLLHLNYNTKSQLLGIINRIWDTVDIPEIWKTGLLIPILKPGKDPKQPSSYRPITLLSCLCKLMERMVYNRLAHHT